jgi:hypothetical protein
MTPYIVAICLVTDFSDSLNGRLLPGTIGRIKDPDGEGPLFLLMDWAYEGQETPLLAFEWGIAW